MIINLSRKSFTIYNFKFLNKGLNFCPTPGLYNSREFANDINHFSRKIKIKAHFGTQTNTSKNENEGFKPETDKTWESHYTHHTIKTFLEGLERDPNQTSSVSLSIIYQKKNKRLYRNFRRWMISSSLKQTKEGRDHHSWCEWLHSWSCTAVKRHSFIWKTGLWSYIYIQQNYQQCNRQLAKSKQTPGESCAITKKWQTKNARILLGSYAKNEIWKYKANNPPKSCVLMSNVEKYWFKLVVFTSWSHYPAIFKMADFSGGQIYGEIWYEPNMVMLGIKWKQILCWCQKWS